MGFNERPMRHLPAFMALKPADRHPKAPTLEHPKDPDISSLHNFIQNRQPSDTCLASCKLVSFTHMISAFASSISKTFGGGGRDRTDDPLLAKQVLSQLSYAPRKVWVKPHRISQSTTKQSFARPTGRRGSCRAPAEHRVLKTRSCVSDKDGGPGRT